MRSDFADSDESAAAIKSDGSLTQMAKDVLRVCDPPATDEEIARALTRHFSFVEPLVRECIQQDLLKEQDGRLAITELGREKLFL
jgi:hypothetical protein